MNFKLTRKTICFLSKLFLFLSNGIVNQHLQIIVSGRRSKRLKRFPFEAMRIMANLKICFLFLCLQSMSINRVNALVEDVIDVLYLGREVIKTISSTWELADQVGVTNEIDLPFMKRKEKKIFSRMAELSEEFRNAEMMVRELTLKHKLNVFINLLFSGSRVVTSHDART